MSTPSRPSDLGDGGRGERPYRLPPLGGHGLDRRWARRMSRRFARVGVGIPASRLREIAGGAVTVPEEAIDVQFALVATALQREKRNARFERSKRRGVQCLVVAGLMLAALNLLVCMVYVFVSMLLHELPF